MDADGTQAGYDLELTRAIAESVQIPVRLRRSSKCEHIYAALTEGKAEGEYLCLTLQALRSASKLT